MANVNGYFHYGTQLASTDIKKCEIPNENIPFLPLVESSISMALWVQWGSFAIVIFWVDLLFFHPWTLWKIELEVSLVFIWQRYSSLWAGYESMGGRGWSGVEVHLLMAKRALGAHSVRLGRPQHHSWCSGEKKSFLFVLGVKFSIFVQHLCLFIVWFVLLMLMLQHLHRKL